MARRKISPIQGKQFNLFETKFQSGAPVICPLGEGKVYQDDGGKYVWVEIQNTARPWPRNHVYQRGEG
jgi:hypothetical protein